jgi:hypothetical protein
MGGKTENTIAKRKRTNNNLQNIYINKRSSNTNPTKNRERTQVLQKGKKFLLH